MEKYSFKEFLIESFKPRIVNFGCDEEMKDRKILVKSFFGDNVYYTFFKTKNMNYCVMLTEHGEISFSSSKQMTVKLSRYNYKQTLIGSSALMVFNSVFYVALQLIKWKKINKFVFMAANENLGKFYEKIVKDDSFNDYLNLNGFYYDGNEIQTIGKKIKKYYVFSRRF